MVELLSMEKGHSGVAGARARVGVMYGGGHMLQSGRSGVYSPKCMSLFKPYLSFFLLLFLTFWLSLDTICVVVLVINVMSETLSTRMSC
jgi:hypothetical protein